MADLEPLATLFAAAEGDEAIPLPPAVRRLYERLSFPANPRPYVISNFVQSLDGVVELGDPTQAGGGPISGFNPHDRFVMAILRATADAVMVGAGTLRSVPKHVWTADHVAPDYTAEWAALRSGLGKPRYPLNVILTASGSIEGSIRVLQQTDVPVLIVTTASGDKRLSATKLPSNVGVVSASQGDSVAPAAALEVVARHTAPGLFLLEGGPTVMGAFLAANLVHEVFITLAPQIAGRGAGAHRPGFVDGRLFAPSDQRWAGLLSLKRAQDMLFLRYAFNRPLSANGEEAGG
ncbi:MAG TPA: dihydrofolate reductase family protein [Dehalococcoidia bacterium]